MAIRVLYEIASLHPRLKHTRQRTEFEERVMTTITSTTTTAITTTETTTTETTTTETTTTETTTTETKI